VWCFLREKFIPLGILCFALSLASKPHDTGLVWLYFLLAGGMFRRRAVQTLLVTAAISIPMFVWVWHLAPNWIRELRSNLASFAVPGGMNDPGLASSGAHGLGMLVSLQTIISVFWNDPRIYNIASYVVIGLLLVVWGILVLRFPQDTGRAWLALASIAALTMLPIYHRQQDTKLLLLTVPACAMLWSEGGIVGRLALLINGAAFVLTGDLAWAVFFSVMNGLHLVSSKPLSRILIVAQVFPVPLILLATGVFYLWVLMADCRRIERPALVQEKFWKVPVR
jgi:hypothetical protein